MGEVTVERCSVDLIVRIGEGRDCLTGIIKQHVELLHSRRQIRAIKGSHTRKFRITSLNILVLLPNTIARLAPELTQTNACNTDPGSVDAADNEIVRAELEVP